MSSQRYIHAPRTSSLSRGRRSRRSRNCRSGADPPQASAPYNNFYMQLHTLSSRTKNKKNPPVGRGGKRGKTSGRGGKGQTARAGHKIRPEVRDLIKKIPKRRGHGKNRARSVRVNRIATSAVNLSRRA